MAKYPQLNRTCRTRAVTPSNAGNPGEPIGLLLALTYSPDHFLPFDALYIGVTGDVVIKGVDGVNVTIKAAPVGVLNVPGWRVMATGTTATDIVAINYE